MNETITNAAYFFEKSVLYHNYIVNYGITVFCFIPLFFIVQYAIKNHCNGDIGNYNFIENCTFLNIFVVISFLCNINFSKQEYKKNQVILAPWRILTLILSFIPLSIHMVLWSSYLTSQGIVYVGGAIYCFFFVGFMIWLEILVMQTESTKIVVSDLRYLDNCFMIFNHVLTSILPTVMYAFMLPDSLKRCGGVSMIKNIAIIFISIFTVYSYTYLQYRRYKFFREIS